MEISRWFKCDENFFIEILFSSARSCWCAVQKINHKSDGRRTRNWRILENTRQRMINSKTPFFGKNEENKKPGCVQQQSYFRQQPFALAASEMLRRETVCPLTYGDKFFQILPNSEPTASRSRNCEMTPAKKFQYSKSFSSGKNWAAAEITYEGKNESRDRDQKMKIGTARKLQTAPHSVRNKRTWAFDGNYSTAQCLERMLRFGVKSETRLQSLFEF